MEWQEWDELGKNDGTGTRALTLRKNSRVQRVPRPGGKGAIRADKTNTSATVACYRPIAVTHDTPLLTVKQVNRPKYDCGAGTVEVHDF